MREAEAHKACSLLVLMQAVFTASALQEGVSVVHPEILRERDSDGRLVLKITNDILLTLHKSSVLSSEFLLRTYFGKIPMHHYMDGAQLEEDLYHDPQNMASVSVTSEGGLRVEGLVGPKLRISPTPNEERLASGHVAHYLSDIPEEDMDNYMEQDIANYSSVARMDFMQPNDGHGKVSGRSDNTIYPELLVFVDSSFAQRFSSSTKIIKYVAITVNAINLRYLSVPSPRVRHRLVGVEILQHYQETAILCPLEWDPKALDTQATLSALHRYVQEKSEYHIYDLVYFLTSKDLARVDPHEVVYKNAGQAYLRGACTPLKVGVGEDTPPTFKGVHVMAHEMGHIMGCLHDGQVSPCAHLGAPSSTHCPFQQGYIMSYVRKDSNSYKFSPCSIEQIREKAWARSGSCLHVKNVIYKRLKVYRYLPGYKVTRSQQCRNAFPSVRNVYFDRKIGVQNCRIQCVLSDYPRESETLNLNDGSPCNGTKYRCINGLCLRRKRRYGVEAVPE
ncbi:venom metalloproteinase antarease TserMP_A-like isoform X2 [Haemaphysalis longicornis]